MSVFAADNRAATHASASSVAAEWAALRHDHRVERSLHLLASAAAYLVLVPLVVLSVVMLWATGRRR